VTGSRIRLEAAGTLEPTTSIAQAYLDERGQTNLADALNSIPGYRGAVTPDGVQNSFGQGVNFINAYKLGSSRTLTLIDGRRAVSSNVPTIFGNAAPGTQVDLNIIPAILVYRVERVGIGGAPAYGSDAIAGTVNIRLRRDFTGLELRGTAGLSDRGDNFRHNLAVLYGGTFNDGRGHLTLALSHDRVDGVKQNRRGFYRANIGEVPNLDAAGLTPDGDGRLNPVIGYDTGPDDGVPGSVMVRDFTIPYLTEGGLIVGGALNRAMQFDRAGNLVPFDRGIRYAGPFAGGGDGFRLNDYGQITSDLRRFSTSLLFDYELNERLRIFAEGLFYDGRADQLVDQPDFNAALFTGRSGPLVFPVTNPFLADQARNLLLANGYGAFMLSRANADIGDPTGYARSQVYRTVLGLDGELALGKRALNFELSVTYGRSDFTDHDQQIDQQRFINAVNVTRDGTGAIVCDPAPILPAGGLPVADPACRPLNLFGEGAPSAESLDYVLRDVAAHSRLEQWVVNANIGGSPFDLFGNPFAFNLGYEHREEKGRFAPDAFLQAGLGRSVAVAPTSGAYDLDEFFGEALYPLIRPENQAIFHRLELFARARYTDNSANGGSTAWTTGGRFQPVPDITLRGNFTRSFRSPSITELHAPQGSAKLTVPDLCSSANITGGPAPDLRARNCAAFLAAFPAATPRLASAISVPALAGGNPALRNERADSWTIGAVVEPRILPGLSLHADYLDIRIVDPIAYLSVTEIASACFDNPDFDLADPAKGNGFCAAIGRDADGQVLADAANPAVRTGFINGKSIRFSGIEAGLDYIAQPDQIGLPGSLAVNGTLFYVRRRVENVTGVNPVRIDGQIGDPEFQGQLRLAYAMPRWGGAVQCNYTGEQLFSRYNRGPSPSDARELDKLDDFVTVDANLFVEPAQGWRLNLAVTNLFNRQGQDYFGYLIPASINDALGRRFTLSLTRRL